ncbi:MAG: hypothetical protein LUH46_01235 [Alistipes sp.]|nr:hypothetical protein [Alistipes sp.]
MKKIILAIATLAAAGFAGCTDSGEIGYDIEPKVLLPNSGLQKIVLAASATDADWRGMDLPQRIPRRLLDSLAVC